MTRHRHSNACPVPCYEGDGDNIYDPCTRHGGAVFIVDTATPNTLWKWVGSAKVCAAHAKVARRIGFRVTPIGNRP